MSRRGEDTSTLVGEPLIVDTFINFPGGQLPVEVYSQFVVCKLTQHYKDEHCQGTKFAVVGAHGMECTCEQQFYVSEHNIKKCCVVADMRSKLNHLKKCTSVSSQTKTRLKKLEKEYKIPKGSLHPALKQTKDLFLNHLRERLLRGQGKYRV